MKARAEASERLSSEIIASLTSGLLVAAEDGLVRTINPAGRAMLRLPEEEPAGHFRQVLRDAAPLADALAECLDTDRPIVRRTIRIPRSEGGSLIASPVGRLAMAFPVSAHWVGLVIVMKHHISLP